MSTSAAATLEWLFRPPPADSGIDRQALAGLLVELARNVEPKSCIEATGVRAIDPRLEQLRELLLGREIELIAELRAVIEDPERLAVAVGRVLPTAVASTDARLGQVLAPALEQATQTSIRSNPRTLVDILHPVIVPAIRKSIGEAIDQTFQSLNESLRQSLTWRGLRWRFEAWRTGTTFAEVVLKHSLIYQVEHVFLIHHQSSLLISHVAAADAASQDPLLVSSMLAAIQDFVRDSFKGAGDQGLDTLRLGELRLWCEAGPLAMLVAVIRGNPPEELRQKLRDTLASIHEERRHALEAFDGDNSALADVEAHLAECAALRQEAAHAPERGFPWLVAAVIFLIVALIGGATLYGWEKAQERARLRAAELQHWSSYVEHMRTAPGIVVTEARAEPDGKFLIAGLRDPLAIDPATALQEAGVDAQRVQSRWQPYQALDPGFTLQRLKAQLAPPPGVMLGLEGERIVASGSAPTDWLARARSAARSLPVGGPVLDLSQVTDQAERQWSRYLERLRATPGIVLTVAEAREGKFVIAGLRDPLALDPDVALQESGLDPSLVESHWQPYQALDPIIVLKRLEAQLAPPKGVTLAIDGERIVATGQATSLWLARARTAARLLPAGGPTLDVSAVQDVAEGAFAKLRDAIHRVEIRFNTNDPLPAPGQDTVLDQLAGELRDMTALATSMHAVARIRLTGHSDDTGPGMHNLSLSMARAGAVGALLKKRGVDSDLITVRGAGPLEPLEPGASEAARSQNRRVSVTVWLEEQP